MNKRIYLDEMGIDDNIVVQYGWAPLGKRSYAEQSGCKKERLSVVAAYQWNDKKLLSPFEFSGRMDSALFSGWFENVLCPELQQGQVIIMDNATFHKSSELHEIAEKYGCRILFLPDYSPDLNTIEKVWANVKGRFRKIIKLADNFQDAITQAFNQTFPC